MNMFPLPIAFSIGLLCFLGFVLSLYFHLVHNHGWDPNQPWIPVLVRMTDCRCDEIVDTEFGLKFGYSNAFWGMWYYLLLAAAVVAHDLVGIPPAGGLLLVVVVAACYSVYLLWALYLMRVICRPCIGVHLVNFLLCALVLSRTWTLLFTT
ncbi:MAG: vitamin K epoxide reductase family protein [Candidatus Neomarinimicrobiota bacterium]|nr:MAG: vitamin K epoxide reductase family protein [Candidatus Neomarinimicrobiota bacterium]